MSSTLQFSDDAFRSGTATELKVDQNLAPDSTSDLFLRHRLKIVEDLWEAVLQQECGQQLVDLLQQLRSLYSPEGEVLSENEEENALKVIESLDLNEAIRTARAFALYFQLINIVEQHYEQRGQQQQYRAEQQAVIREDLLESGHVPDESDPEAKGSVLHANLLEKSLTVPPRREVGTFQALFPKLHRLNVPPRQIQNMIDQL
ncbi:phosphoenolpyruvate carboxylase, partial [filamentous cyanobacterium CCP1]